ncbi:hypothetical protein [Micromonospora inyonensis]|uniref:Uncharacterized protein n=1 Tax=Micromonospora inyonensis TaxID=47866 RepID=A0A1C6RCL7_9ACTN|nr:hypothetical protein [Micromonospora inyonensis]SCL14728.1 hypothetical protein GA0074694_0890 [Micromonospora inyonensis]
MRLTVGPLPPAVYWRRRAVVLGAGILFLIVVLYSCSGSSDKTASPERSPTPTPSAGDPTGSVLTPQSGEPPASAGPGAPGGGGPAGGGPGDGGGPAATSGAPVGPGDPIVPAGGAGACTDAEVSVTPVVAPASVRSGGTVDLQLRIRNTSDRTCTRDVGADLQELFVKSGAEKVWSSDTCGTAKGSDVQSFTPGFERSYQVTWNGLDTTKCANGLASGKPAPPGTYQVFGRLDAKLSAPVKLTVVD